MIKKLLYLSFAMACVSASLAQNSGQNYTISPYSNFGLGELLGNNFIQAGNANQTHSGSYSYSLQNPASIGFLRYTSFDFGFHGKTGVLSSADQKQSFNGGGLNYLSLGFNTLNRNFYKKYLDSLGKPKQKKLLNIDWNSYFTLVPYTSVGYNYSLESSIPVPTATAHTGTGGVNVFEFGNALRMGEKFSLGYSAGYVFGRISDNSIFTVKDSSGYMIVNDLKSIDIKGLQHQLGVLYRHEYDSIIHKFGASYKFYSGTKAAQTRLTQNLIAPISGGLYVSDTILNISNGYKAFSIPGTIGLGYSMQWRKAWSISLDYKQQMWGNYKSYFANTNNLTTRKDYAFGFTLFPEDEKPSGKKKMPVQVRMGGRYSQTQNVFNQNNQKIQIEERSAFLGFGIPISRRYFDNRVLRSMINVQFSYLTRGKNSSGLAKEEYYMLTVGFNMGDIWFQKRKFD